MGSVQRHQLFLYRSSRLARPITRGVAPLPRSKRSDLLKLRFILQEDGSVTLAPKAAPVAPALSQEYLEYFLQENWGVGVGEWISNFPHPAEIVDHLQSILKKDVALDAFLEAVRETMDTRGTYKRKLEELAK